MNTEPKYTIFQSRYLDTREQNPDQDWIEYNGLKVWGGYQEYFKSPQRFKLTILDFDTKLARKTKQELCIIGIYESKLISEYANSYHSNYTVKHNKEPYDEMEIRVKTKILNKPIIFDYYPSKHAKSGITLFNMWHISRFTTTNSFDPGTSTVHNLNNYGMLIEDETPTSKILRINSGAKPVEAPITFDDIILRLETSPI